MDPCASTGISAQSSKAEHTPIHSASPKTGMLALWVANKNCRLRFSGAQLLHDAFGNEGVVEVVFRLIHDQRIRVVEEQQVQNGRALLPGRQAIQIPILLTGVGYVELEAHPFLKVNGFQGKELCRHHPIQSLGKAGRQSPSLAQERVLSSRMAAARPITVRSCASSTHSVFRSPDARQTLQEVP